VPPVDPPSTPLRRRRELERLDAHLLSSVSISSLTASPGLDSPEKRRRMGFDKKGPEAPELKAKAATGEIEQLTDRQKELKAKERLEREVGEDLVSPGTEKKPAPPPGQNSEFGSAPSPRPSEKLGTKTHLNF
jgi:hypothetical protein